MNKKITNAVFCMLSAAMIAGCSKPSIPGDENVTSSDSKNPASTSAATIYAYKTIGNDLSSVRLAQQTNLSYNSSASSATVIDVKTALRQSILGMGTAITGSAATNILRLTSLADRQKLYREIFTKNVDANGKKQGLDLNIIRITIGASDYSIPINGSDTQGFYTYRDNSASFDSDIKVHTDTKNMIQVVKEIQGVLSGIKNLYIIASPWTAPAWMKVNNSLIDQYENATGSTTNKLSSNSYVSYAYYLAKYVKVMEGEGIWVDAITCVNEPRNSEMYPSMIMFSGDQSSFIPTLTTELNNISLAAGHKVAVFAGDNNWSGSDYPTTVLNNNALVASTSNGLRGGAFHAYNGDASAMTTFHNAFTSAEIHMTEWSGNKVQTFGSLGDQMKNKILDCFSNWANSVTFWNLALNSDSSPGPNIRPGVNSGRAYLTIPSSNPTLANITRNLDYYLFGHVSRFIKSGSRRVESTLTSSTSIDGLVQVAFKDPDGWVTLVVANTSTSSSKSFIVKNNGSATNKFFYTLEANSVITFNWDSTL